jgi:uncharacterized OB-fold protein
VSGEGARGAGAPLGDEDSAPWWQALADGRLEIQQCSSCDEVRMQPLPGCPQCGSGEFVVRQARGTGRIYSGIVIHRPVGTLRQDELPRTIVTVDLDEGCRMIGRLIESEPPAIGRRVRAVIQRTEHGAELAFTFQP